MLNLILMLIALAFGNNSANTQSCNNNNNGQVTTQLAPGGGTDPGTDPGTGTGGDGEPVGGNTGQLPPPFTNP